MPGDWSLLGLLVAVIVASCLLSLVLIRYAPRLRFLPAALLFAVGLLFLLSVPGLRPKSSGWSGFEGMAAAAATVLGLAAMVVAVVTFLFTTVSWWTRSPARPAWQDAGEATPARPEWDGGPRSEEFALIQRDIGQTISRAAMEEATLAVPRITRSDAAMLHRLLFGIVVRKMDAATVRALQGELRARGMETEVVPESEIIPLTVARMGRGLRLEGDTLVETDVTGREHAYPKSQLVFAAAGCIQARVFREDRVVTPVVVRDMRGHARVDTEIEKRSRWEDSECFRIECFFADDPPRIAWQVEKGRPLVLNGVSVGLEDTEALNRFVAELRAFVPPGRMNRGLAQAGVDAIPVYPGLVAFEEETLWNFHRLRRT